MVEYGRKIEEKVKAVKSEIKENVQGTNSDGKETRTQINDLEQKEEINTQPEQMKKQEFKKMRRGLGTLQENLKHSNIRIIGVPEEKEEEQEIEKTYLKK